MSAAGTPMDVPKGKPSGLARNSLARNPLALLSLAGFLLLVLSAILAPLLSPYNPTDMNYDAILSPPDAAHPFGTDDLGRDVLSRVLWGGRESLRVGILAILIAGTVSINLGLVSGYLGGWVDNLIMRIMDVFLAFPHILLVISIVAILGPGLTTVLIALGVSYVPGATRFVRGTVLAVKDRDYIVAARVLGASDAYIMFTQVLPNILAPVIIYSTLGLGSAIMATAGLSYIGLGAQPPSPEWGAMLNAARSYIREAWWLTFFPGLAIFIAVLCINLLGDGLRDALDPRLRE
ncbi:MAG: ABC transporter permease [Rectinemataceae bacterium]